MDTAFGNYESLASPGAPAESEQDKHCLESARKRFESEVPLNTCNERGHSLDLVLIFSQETNKMANSENKPVLFRFQLSLESMS